MSNAAPTSLLGDTNIKFADGSLGLEVITNPTSGSRSIKLAESLDNTKWCLGYLDSTAGIQMLAIGNPINPIDTITLNCDALTINADLGAISADCHSLSLNILDGSGYILNDNPTYGVFFGFAGAPWSVAGNALRCPAGYAQVLTNRQTGWFAPTNTSSKATFDTATVTTAQLAQRVKALIDDLMTHGLIGA